MVLEMGASIENNWSATLDLLLPDGRFFGGIYAQCCQLDLLSDSWGVAGGNNVHLVSYVLPGEHLSRLIRGPLLAYPGRSKRTNSQAR